MRISSSGTSRISSTSGPVSINGLSKGDTFAAVVTGVSGNEVSLNLQNGGQFNARSQNPQNLKKGERVTFTVEAKESGHIYVRMHKGASPEILKIAEKAVEDANLPLNEKNVDMARALIEGGVRPSAELLQKSAAVLSYEYMTVDKLLFFLTEDIEINEESIKQLNNNITGRNGINDELNRLMEKISQLPQEEKNEAAELLGIKGSQKTDLMTDIKNALFFDVKNGDLKDVPAFYERLASIMDRLQGFNKGGELGGISEVAKRVKNALNFQMSVKGNKQYMQIPFSFDGFSGKCDFYVFRGNAGKVTNASKKVTALLGFDFPNMGRVEALIELSGKNVNCMFGLSEPLIVKLVSDNIFELHKLLAQKGFKLDSTDFQIIERPFNLLSDPPLPQSDGKVRAKKYSFDMKA